MNNNIEDLIESKIDSIVKENNIYHVGKVVRINSFVIEATGLEDAFFFEKVFIGDEENVGYVDKIEENKVIIALVKTNGNIKIGDSIKTTGEPLQAGFSKNAIGMITDIFGADRMTGKSFNESKQIPIETEKIPIMDRTAVNRPLETGIAGIDLMFPIGKGQRQLIIGDKKTGKTQILLDTIVNQKGKDVICIYVSIGKTKKDIKRLYTKLIEKGASSYTQIIAAFNDDTSPMIKLTPYVGLSVAEEYMHEGKDVLVCIDDLKKHADACREIALIAEKNTGREAYPADIFYTHSRLLEKGCQYKNGGSITILPVVETKGGDITDYVSTNIISITDGQIVLSEKNFKKGQKPALDFGLSVSRLGGAVQKDSIKKVGAAVRRELLSYLETADVYQLVKIDSMSKELQEKIFRGKKLLELLNQPKFAHRSEEKMIQNFGFILDAHALGENIVNEEEQPMVQQEVQQIGQAYVPEEVPQSVEQVVVQQEVTQQVEQGFVPQEIPQPVEQVVVPQEIPQQVEQAFVPQEIPQSVEQVVVQQEVPQQVEQAFVPQEIPHPIEQVIVQQEVPQQVEQGFVPEEVPQVVEQYEEPQMETSVEITPIELPTEVPSEEPIQESTTEDDEYYDTEMLDLTSAFEKVAEPETEEETEAPTLIPLNEIAADMLPQTIEEPIMVTAEEPQMITEPQLTPIEITDEKPVIESTNEDPIIETDEEVE